MKENIKLKRRIVYRGQVYDALEAERIKAIGNITKPYYDGYADGLKRAIEILANDVEDVPDDAAPVESGKWEEVEKNGKWGIYCSACGSNIPNGKYGTPWWSLYCPSCGAKMEG